MKCPESLSKDGQRRIGTWVVPLLSASSREREQHSHSPERQGVRDQGERSQDWCQRGRKIGPGRDLARMRETEVRQREEADRQVHPLPTESLREVWGSSPLRRQSRE